MSAFYYSTIIFFKVDLSLLCLHPSPQTSLPAAQEAPADDTADLLGLNSDPELLPVSSSSSSAPQGVQGGLKTSSSNSDLLNDLFAPPAAHTAPVQEDLFFGGPPNGATPVQKCKDNNCFSMFNMH